MDENVTDGIFEGSGPFAIPLLAELVSIIMAKDKRDCVIAEFRFEDGATVYVPIASRAAGPLVDMLATVPAVRGTVKPFPARKGE